MNKTHKEIIVGKLSPLYGRVRKFYYSENPQFPKYRLLLEQSGGSDASNLWNSLLDFNLLINYDEVSSKQRTVKIVVTFHNWTCSSFIDAGFEHLQEDGISPQELLNCLKEVGAERQYNIVTSYINSSEHELNRQYYQYQSEMPRLIEEYVRQNITEFVKWV